MLCTDPDLKRGLEADPFFFIKLGSIVSDPDKGALFGSGS